MTATIDRLVQLPAHAIITRAEAWAMIEDAVEAYGPDRDPRYVLISWDGLHDAFFGYTSDPDHRWVRPGLSYTTISGAVDLNVIDTSTTII